MYRIGGRLGSIGVSLCGVTLGIPPLVCWILTCGRESGRGTLLGGQFDWGGRLLKCNGGAQRLAQHGWKPCNECKRISQPDCETDGYEQRRKSELVIRWYVSGNCHRSTDKSYPGDNRLISPKRPQRRGGLAPRCRLVASWGCIRSQGFGCSPIKAARELGSERRETVRSLSVAGVGDLKGAVLSTRGPGWTYLWCTSCTAKCMAG